MEIITKTNCAKISDSNNFSYFYDKYHIYISTNRMVFFMINKHSKSDKVKELKMVTHKSDRHLDVDIQCDRISLRENV